MRISTKKILMAVLSLILIFAVSCGDKPTESTPETGDALVSSVPSPTGNPVSESDALYHNGGKEYTNIILTFIENESKLEDNYEVFTNKEKFFEEKGKITNYTLSITNGSVTFESIEETTTEKYTNTILNGQLLYKDGDKYNAGYSTASSTNGIHALLKYYIEFKKGEGDNLTDFKYVTAISVKGTFTNTVYVDVGMKSVYKQNK